MRRTRWIAVTLGAVLTASACGTGSLDKAGGEGGITVLRLATPDPVGRASSKDAEHLAERVHELSDGRLRVEIVWEAAGRAGSGVRSWDQEVARRVLDGREELGFVPARAWDELGVTSLQPLQAPFLVTTDAALDAVVGDEVAERMLAGLEPIGVTGLALVPEALRHPVGRDGPLLEPADFDGALVRAPRSQLTWEVLRALGAEPDDMDGDDLLAAVESGELRGAETSVALLPTLQWSGVVSGNVTPYGKVNVIAVSTAVFERLTSGERAVLRRAAVETRDHAVETRQDDADALRAACEAGAVVAVASEAQLQALEEATAGVGEGLRSDADVGHLLDRVTEVVEGTGPPPEVEACNGDTADAPGSGETLGPDGSPAFPEGIYRWRLTEDQLTDVGVDDASAYSNSGLMTFTIGDGRWLHHTEHPSRPPDCGGTYAVSGSRITFTADRTSNCGSAAGGTLFSGAWTEHPDGVRFVDIRPDDPFMRVLWGGSLWQRIG